MAYPVWTTPSGNLGKIQALQFFDLSLQAIDPTGAPDGSDITYQLISGRLPAGLQVDASGKIAGNPNDTYQIDGVPFAVDQDRTSEFTVRATNSAGLFTDQNFVITITGNYPPQLLTSNYTALGQFFDGSEVSIQLSAVDLNYDTLTFSILEGNLPPGLNLNSDGLISGVLEPTHLQAGPGWDTTYIGWDTLSWDQGTVGDYTKIDRIVYTFTIEVSDTKSVDLRTYAIVVYNKSDVTADNAIITDDNAVFTSDIINIRTPILLTKSLGNYATFTSDNYFAFKFEAVDFDNTGIIFASVGAAGTGFDASSQNYPVVDPVDGWDSQSFDQSTLGIPTFLNLYENGWLVGYIPPQTAVSQTFNFAISVKNAVDNTISSPPRLFTLTILGNLNLEVIWNTPSDLGFLDAGSTSQLSISATTPSNRPLYYSLLTTNSKLPQGLKLLSDGNIVGRTSFQTFSLDEGKTTFDLKNKQDGLYTAITTFDKTYTFTIIVTDFSAKISGQKTFKVKINSVTYSPYDNLYLSCIPSIGKRDVLNTILGNTDFLNPEDIYRPNDSYFGVQKDLRLLVGYGLTSSEAYAYINAMQKRHFNKKFFFGSYSYATASDANGNPLYDVVYVNLVEDTKIYSKNSSGTNIRNIPASSFTTIDGTTLYPNDLDLMIDDIVVAIGQTNVNTLPQWQTSIQPDGKVVGFQTAAVLAYLKPGTGAKILYKLNNEVPSDIKQIPFVAERYILDNNLDINYNIPITTSGNISAGSYAISNIVNPNFIQTGYKITGNNIPSGTYVKSIQGNSVTMTNAATLAANGSAVSITFGGTFASKSYTTFDTGFIKSVSPVATVDYAIDIPFSYVDGKTISQINAIGGFDGDQSGAWNNKTLIFSTQENYVGVFTNLTNDGWIQNNSIVPGYTEVTNGTSTVNKRSGIWNISVNNGLVNLTFVKSVLVGQVVSIRFGAKSRKSVDYSASGIGVGSQKVPEYINVNIDTLQKKIPTTFDTGNTVFINNEDQYLTPFANDRYLKFTKTNIYQ